MRHVVVRKGDDWKQARLVYDYKGYGHVPFLLNLHSETDPFSLELRRKMTTTKLWRTRHGDGYWL